MKGEPAPATGAAPASSAAIVAPPPIGYFELYKFATRGEIALLLTSVVAALGNGAALPGFSILFGILLNNLNATNFVSKISLICLAFFLMGIATFFLSIAEMAFFNIVATRQIRRIRVRRLCVAASATCVARGAPSSRWNTVICASFCLFVGMGSGGVACVLCR